MNPDLLELPNSKEEATEAIVGVYLNYAAYCKELGVEFMAGYYNPHNQALNPAIRTERAYPIVTVQKYLEKAVTSGNISLKLEISDVVNDIRMLIIGNVFDWALQKGLSDFEGNIRRSITYYLEGVLI